MADAQIIFIPGGFSGGDEPDGSAKFITAFFRSPAVRDAVKGKNNVAAAKELGAYAGKAAREKGIETVVFDRGGFSYKGRVKALADAARAAGLKF